MIFLYPLLSLNAMNDFVLNLLAPLLLGFCVRSRLVSGHILMEYLLKIFLGYFLYSFVIV